MDPNATLAEMLALAKQLNNSDDLFDDNGIRLAELVLALNEWLSGGGFLPIAWQRHQQQPVTGAIECLQELYNWLQAEEAYCCGPETGVYQKVRAKIYAMKVDARATPTEQPCNHEWAIPPLYYDETATPYCKLCGIFGPSKLDTSA